METLKLIAPLAWRNLWRNPRRTAITLVVVAVGLYSILVFAALLDAWAQSSRDAQLNLLTGSGQIHARGYLDDPVVDRRMPPPDAGLTAALNVPQVQGWAERVRVPAVIQSEYKTLPLTLLGVKPKSERAISFLPKQIVEGSYLSGNDDPGIVLGRHLAQRLKTRVGKRVILMAQSADGSLAQRAYQVKGLFAGNQSAEDSYAFTGIETAQQMLGIGDGISEISFRLADGAALAPEIARLRAAAPKLDVEPWKKLAPLAAAVDSFMTAFVYIWLWVMFVFMAIGIVNTQLMAVFERVREFGLLQALGMRPRLILAQVLLESALLIGVGVIIGMVASGATIAALKGGIDLGFLARGAEFVGAGHVLYPHLAPSEFFEMSLLVWVLGVVIALWPARKAAHSRPVEAMSHAT
ncbi:ABC transporter permease [Acidimangrovimonas pyrenivorans]|uniref:ABC transporter permease n=1 Tax=Acidimangrovimonas pyrenivorans TaxID=2030798 RepID=A0ABV7AML6_9RHOB